MIIIIVCCAAVLGTTFLISAVLLSATSTFPSTASAISVFGLSVLPPGLNLATGYVEATETTSSARLTDGGAVSSLNLGINIINVPQLPLLVFSNHFKIDRLEFMEQITNNQ